MVKPRKSGKKKNKTKTPGHQNTTPTSVSWEGVKGKSEPLCSTKTIMIVLGVLLAILMIDLYFFVEDPVVEVPESQQAPEQAPKNFTRPPRRPTFELTEEVDIGTLQELIKELDDRILVVAFEEANVEGNKKQLWKRWERLARAFPKKPQFRRLDEDEYPKVVRFDCSTAEAKAACEQLVGSKLPAAIFWKSKIPRFFPDDVRTDTHVFNYLETQLEEAVSYVETTEEAEYFITEEGINVMFFGKDPNNVYMQVADVLRDNANFGRTAVADVSASFDAEMPSLRMYRPFDESPVHFEGNITDYATIVSFIREHSVPLFGEWKPSTIKMYQNRKLPVVFIAVDFTEDETETVLEAAKKLASEFWGTLSFAQLDAIMNADLARRLGVTKAPECLIMSGKETRMAIDYDYPEASIRAAIDEWEQAATRGPEPDVDEYEEYDELYDEDEYEEEEEVIDSDSEEEEASHEEL